MIEKSKIIRRRHKTPWLIKPGYEWRGEPDEALAKTGLAMTNFARYNGFKAVARFIKKIIFCFWLIGLVTCGVFEKQIFGADSPTDPDHGWAMLDSVRSFMPYPVSFYAISRGLMSRMHDGMVIRIKSLKTGSGSYYKLEKDSNGVWSAKADTKDPKDPAAQFLVSISDKYITLTSEVADGFLLASTPQTFDVTLVNENDIKNDNSKADSTLWGLIEDPNAGDTLESCYLKNKATGGMLTASYDASGGDSGSQITQLTQQIAQAQKSTPYLQIIYARSGGTFHNNDIADALNKQISDDGVLKLTGNWIERISGYSSWAAGTGSPSISGRTATIRFIVNGDKTKETEVKAREKDNSLIISPYEGKFAQQLAAAYANNPATPLKKSLATLQSKVAAAGQLNLSTSQIGRTGFTGGGPFDVNQSSKIAIEPVVDLGDDNNITKDKIEIAAAQEGGFVKQDLDKIWIHQKPEFEGSFKETLDFGPGQVITVNPLSSKGYVWFNQTLQTAGYGTVTFRAFTQESDIQVCFSDAVEPRTIYRIVFGASANTKTVIYKNDVPVQEINNNQSTRARISPGKIQGFWVSLNNGFIIIGKGDPGTNIIMAWQDPTPPANVKQVGFSTYKSVVRYTDVQIIDNPVVVVAPIGKAYVTDSSPIQVGTVEAPVWHRLPLSPPDKGTIVFQATGPSGSGEATLILANDKNEGYAITFGADGNTVTKIVALENKQELYKIDIKATPLAGLDAGSPNKFWVNLYKGMIILGKGDVGKNTFCVYVDSNVDSNGNLTAPDGVFKIGFAGTASLQNLEIWPEVTLGFDQNVAQFVKQHQIAKAQGKLNIISPFDYSIEQEGPVIVFKNRITGMITNIAGTPSPLLVYHFTLDIGKDGCPNLLPGQNAPTPEKIIMETSVKVLQAAQDTVFNQVMTTAYEASQENDPIEGWLTGPIMLLEASAIGAGGIAIAAAQSGIQTKLNEMNALGNRQINTEKVIRMAGGSTAVSDEAKNNQQQFEAALQTIFGPLPNDPNDPNAVAKRNAAGQLDYKTGLWDGALRLITDSYVVGDTDEKKKENKSSITSGLSDLYNGVMGLGLSGDTALLYNRMMNILIMAYNNAYLTSYGDLFDDQNRANWYLWINNLAKAFFSSQDFMKNGVAINFKGEYLWFPISFSQPGSGSITFEVQAASDVFVCLSENAVQTSDTLKHIYEIVFGAWDNKLTVIRREALGDDAVEFDNGKIPDLCPDPMTFKKYWININNGVLSGGVGDLGQNKLWEWTDPYPAVPVKWVGFSNWLSAVTIRNVQISNCL